MCSIMFPVSKDEASAVVYMALPHRSRGQMVRYVQPAAVTFEVGWRSGLVFPETHIPRGFLFMGRYQVLT